MLTVPSAPARLTDLIDGYAATGAAILALGTACTAADFDRPTALPGWSVKDVLAHVAGLEHHLHGGVDEDVEVPDHEWIRSPTGRFMERAVEVRRPRAGADVVGEWRDLLPQRLKALRDPALTGDSVVQSPVGSVPLTEFVFLRLIDLWCHEQDLRDALGRSGNLDSAGAAAFTGYVLDSFPDRAAQRAQLSIGAVVVVESTGPVLARRAVRIVPGPDGGLQGEALPDGRAPADGMETTIVRLSTAALTRRGAGRVPTADLEYVVQGDADVAVRVLDVLTVTP